MPTPDRPHEVDALDARIVEMFAAEPRVGVLECSRRLGVARGHRAGQAGPDGSRTASSAAGDPSSTRPPWATSSPAFVTLEIRQHHPERAAHDAVAEQLADVPEVLEAHTTTGTGDMLVRIVARSNADLQRVIDRLLAADGVVRASTVIALDTQISPRVLPLVRVAATID